MPTEFIPECKIERIKIYERNPRKISAKAVEAVAKSIRMNGALDPIEVDEDMTILAGHTRLKAYRELKYDRVPVIQHTGLTSVQKRTYRIASNKTAEYSEWDDELLAAELKDIDIQTEKLIEATGCELLNENIPENNKHIDEEEMKNTRHECPKCGFEW